MCAVGRKIVIAIFAMLTIPSADHAEEVASPDPAPAWTGIISDLVLSLMPDDYVDDRHWGQTRKVVSGVRARTKGGQLRLEPREKKVNHGIWRKVTIKLLRPAETFRIEFRNVRTMDTGETRFDLFLTCRARVEAQLAIWNSGIKGLNGSLESDVTLQSLADCSFRIETRRGENRWLPELLLRPKIHDLRLKLTDVDTRKAGPIGGWVAEELGNATRRTVEDLLQTQEPKILARIRKSLAKCEDRLRLDLGRVESLWGGKPADQPMLPAIPRL